MQETRQWEQSKRNSWNSNPQYKILEVFTVSGELPGSLHFLAFVGSKKDYFHLNSGPNDMS